MVFICPRMWEALQPVAQCCWTALVFKTQDSFRVLVFICSKELLTVAAVCSLSCRGLPHGADTSREMMVGFLWSADFTCGAHLSYSLSSLEDIGNGSKEPNYISIVCAQRFICLFTREVSLASQSSKSYNHNNNPPTQWCVRISKSEEVCLG